GNGTFTGAFRAEGGIVLRRVHFGGDLDCDGGRFIASDGGALDADLVDVAGQIKLGSGFHAQGGVRVVYATVGRALDCHNGHFLNPNGDSLTLDGAVVGRCLRIGGTLRSQKNAKDLPASFIACGTVRLWSTQVNQDVLATGGHFETPGGNAIIANNLRVASR